MSESIDRRVVEMAFDAKDFLQNVGTTLGALDKLNQALNFKGSASSGVESMSGLGSAVEGVKNRFSALEVVGMTALVNLTNSAVNLGKRLASSLTIDQVKAGFGEYELKMNSIQTIMASTNREGKEGLAEVNRYLNELNTYADKTIYSFSDMTSSIGKFTNAGVDLDTAVKAIQGISNEAAVSGANANEASRAMYNFAQALSAGYVKLIDWKSIENANMATKEFKQQLIDTAVAEGTLEKSADGMYKVLTTGTGGRGFKETMSATKNFNDSLSAAWMTTDVLTKTLGRYSDVTTDIGKKAFAAAQDVKTFSQLLDTVKESIGSGWAQTFEIIFGNLDEAKKLWTSVNNVISGFVNYTSGARNTILQTWKDLGGRKDIANGLKTAFGALRDAFTAAFPPKTTEQFEKIGKKLKDITAGFAEHMKVFKLHQGAFTDIFKAVGDVVGLVKDAFAGLFDVLNGGGGESALENMLSTFVELVAFISRGISALIEFGRESGVFKIVHDLLIGVNDILVGLIDTAYMFADSLTDAIDKIPAPVVHLGDTLDKAFAVFDEKKVKVIDVITNAIGNLFSLLGKFISHVDLGDIGKVLAGSGILMAGKKLADMLGGLQIKFEDILKLPKSLSSIKKTFQGLSDTLNEFTGTLRTAKLLGVASALAVLAYSCVQLSKVPIDKLGKALGAIATLFGELAGASWLLKGNTAKGLITLSFAIVVLSKAVKTLSEVGSIGKGLVGVGVLLAELAAFCYIFDKQKIKPKALNRTARGLILMGIAINLLAKPIKDLGAMDPDELTQGLLAMAYALGGFTLVAKAFTKIKTKGLVEAGKAMVIMAAAMNLLVLPISALGKMNVKSLGKGLGGMAVALLEIAGFTAVMGQIAQSSGNILKASAALLVMSIGIKIMAGALDQMGANAQAGQGLSVMFGSLLVLAMAMTAMQNAVGGAAAMILAASALAIMAPAIALLSSLPMLGVAAGMAALAGTLLIFGGLSALLAPLTPVMLALTGALALLGVAVAGVGAGMMLMVGAFLMATGPVTKGAEKLAQAFPIIAKGIGEGLITIIKTVGDGVTEIKNTLVKIIEAIIEIIQESGPRLIECGLQMILMLLNGINEHIGEITVVALSVITNFIAGLAEGMPGLIDAGMTLIITLINSLADAIAENGTALANAFINVILAALEAIVGLVPGFGKPAAEAIEKYRQGFAKGGKSVDATAKNISTSASTNLKVADQYSNGTNAVQGLINGLDAMKPAAYRAAYSVGKSADQGMKDGSGVRSPSWKAFETGKYIIQGLVNGMNAFSDRAEDTASGIATTVIGAYNHKLGDLDVFNGTFTPTFDLTRVNRQVSAIDASFSRDDDRIAESIERLSDRLESVTDTMNSRQLINNIQIDGSEDPTAFADALTSRFKLKARTM